MIEQSLWREHPVPRFKGPLPNRVDVVVVGGGITGLTAALLLKQAGKTVAVLERDHVGGGETASTSAHLTYVTDLALTQLVARFGRDAARRVWQGGAAAIDLIETNASQRGIACGFQRVPGFLCAPFLENAEAPELQEQATLAAELGFAARYLDHGPITGRAAVAFADQAIVHPIDYIIGLALAVDGGGSFVRDMTPVGHVIQDPLAVIVNGEHLACDDVIIATHVPIMGIASLIGATLFQTKLYPYSTYVLGARVDDSAPAPGLYSDTTDPYHYLRIHEDAGGRYAIFGGEDHKTGKEGDTESRFTRLESAFHSLFPSAKVERRWSGQVIETSDGLPFVGETADHQYAATGYAGNGLTFGTLAAMMLHDAIVGTKNPWRELFDPQRKPTSIGAIAHVVAENVDYPYHYIADRLRTRDQGDAASLAPGDGKVLTIDGQRVACHRTKEGTLVKVSAYCTHMGCLVRWNGAESTWDCPCHGSRFSAEGDVIGGPAETPLEPI